MQRRSKPSSSDASTPLLPTTNASPSKDKIAGGGGIASVPSSSSSSLRKRNQQGSSVGRHKKKGTLRMFETILLLMLGGFMFLVFRIVLDRSASFSSDGKSSGDFLQQPHHISPHTTSVKFMREQSSMEATAAMKGMPSSEVDGEKKLKVELKKLSALQADGKCLGVKVLTRWEGDDVPVWECDEMNTKQKEATKEEVEEKEDEKEGEERTPDDAQETIPEADKEDGMTFPSTFPSPLDAAGPDAVVVLEPAFGVHRLDQDAVFAFAQGYDLVNYLLFVLSLRKTGFDGDIVLSVSSLDQLKPGVEEFLRSMKHVVVYAVEWTCFKKSGDPIATPTAESDCHLNGMFGRKEGDGGMEELGDAREPRPLATARFELYWAWSLRYSPLSYILLIDFRDAYFQLHPFHKAERSEKGSTEGNLLFFEENGPIADSSFNMQWIRQAYGAPTLTKLINNKIICSGSTMGEQVAMEPYLRAMVLQFDNTKCKRKGCDQGFHNYLIHSHTLQNAKGIRNHGGSKYAQGKGVINNLSLLRDISLRERGLLEGDQGSDEIKVKNWDGTVSPIVHQWDRDEELSAVIKRRMKTMKSGWADVKDKGKGDFTG
mmetsp:Transcript_48581/g.72081  ORF Transcript_48581/g.72081 Transcript_48581/m.72081 type:complete len:600 (+) Transcript_48581:72-1871(+)|eukprot:CAMPEP_0195525330 /NCGR_PEP_ID=MMETSP0794_2-20130614/25734_1 /TAXON_ID=515487 /ORGANISM="Stephanopyxis turris, Strain CCMP 815" /LENGTH=599 /DNA_ID=CAMNT_0040655773 /DNA_START=66 /DNA_END=1865 /DNA_ORIENTATION=+